MEYLFSTFIYHCECTDSFIFQQRYHTEDIAQLEALQRDASDDGGKLLRKHLGFMLKNESSKLNVVGEMRVYHPDGVQKQREAEALKVGSLLAVAYLLFSHHLDR